VTWIPCGMCNGIPCMCSWTVKPYQVPAITTTTFTWPVRTLTEADVEAIAERVAQKLREKP
jgi:hypothetical protein